MYIFIKVVDKKQNRPILEPGIDVLGFYLFFYTYTVRITKCISICFRLTYEVHIYSYPLDAGELFCLQIS